MSYEPLETIGFYVIGFIYRVMASECTFAVMGHALVANSSKGFAAV